MFSKKEMVVFKLMVAFGLTSSIFMIGLLMIQTIIDFGLYGLFGLISFAVFFLIVYYFLGGNDD